MNIAEDNLASKAVAERCGYAIENTLHDYFSLDDGHHDCYVYGKRKKSGSTKTGTRIGKFTVISIVLSVFNFLFYTLLARLFFKNNSWLWLDSAIACAATAILAYVLHSKITWKERPVSKRGLAMFFLWNGLLAFVICPFFTWAFGFIKPLYSFVFDVLSAIHLPIDYPLVESTVIFILTTIVVLILNYIFYDKLVFGNQKSSKK